MQLVRQQIRSATFPDSPGVYFVFDGTTETRPLYVGVAAKRSLKARWQSDHLRPRAGSSALRRSLGVHLALVAAKLRRPERYYPPAVEEAITRYLQDCWIEFISCPDGATAIAEEAKQIELRQPLLNCTP